LYLVNSYKKTVNLLTAGFLLLILLIIPQNTNASENCSNRYVTFINPIRGRNLWSDNSLKPLNDQYSALNQYGFSATWLLQYDNLKDGELLKEIKKFNSSHEIAVFLEVSEKLATQSRIIYPYNVTWSSPSAVFLSSYSQSERKRIIDKLFNDFKNEFGFFPKSVGAWWIDSYSLNYLKEKYNVNSALIVADQTTTDSYGVWGQWWGVAYYPSKANILTPASSLDNKLNVVITQWAQRDPLRSYGDGPKYSNFSLQANDYKDRGKNTDYFLEIAKVYLDCSNPLGQITVGLETGMESVAQIEEYKNQLSRLKELDSLKAVTMNEFAQKFAEVYPDFPQELTISYQDSKWILTPNQRSNEKLADTIKYNPSVAFADYFLADKSKFLNRRLANENNQQTKKWFPWYSVVILALGIFVFQKNLKKIWLVSMLFSFSAFGLILKSYYQYGWEIFFGPKISFLTGIQILIIIFTFVMIWFLYKYKKINPKLKDLFIWLIPLSFGVDVLLKLFRYSFISDKHLFGIAVDSLRFTGFTLSKNFKLEFINADLPSYQAAALLRFNFEKIWENLTLSLFIYPLAHIILAFGLAWLLSLLPGKIKTTTLAILICLLGIHLLQIYFSNPLYLEVLK
jgi:hypothetical protein